MLAHFGITLNRSRRMHHTYNCSTFTLPSDVHYAGNVYIIVVSVMHLSGVCSSVCLPRLSSPDTQLTHQQAAYDAASARFIPAAQGLIHE